MKHALRNLSTTLFVLTGLSLTVSACGAGAGGNAVRPDDPTAGGALGKGGAGTACSDVADEPQLLTLDWEDTARIELERAMATQVAVVHYDCKGFKVLRDCSVKGDYQYAGVSPAKTVAKLKDRDQLQANLPLGAATLSSEMNRGSTIDIVYLAVGQQSTTIHDVPVAKLVGKCEGATHTVRTANLGAFALTTGTDGSVNAAASLFGKGASGSSSSSKSVEKVNGELDACNSASDTSKEPTSKCKALVQLLLSPVVKSGEAPKAAPPSSGEKDKEQSVAIAKNTCPSGFRLDANNICSKPGQGGAFACDPRNFDECKTNCGKGDGRSCYNAATNRLDYKLNAGKASKERYADAYPFLEKSCAANNGPGCTQLGYATRWGYGIQENPEKSITLYEKACQIGDAPACYYLGNNRKGGYSGFTKDVEMARKNFERACSLGDSWSCNYASQMMVEGVGGPKDVEGAAKMLQRACGQDENICKKGMAIANTEAGLSGTGDKVTLKESPKSLEAIVTPCKSEFRVDDKTMTCVKPAEASSFMCEVSNLDECKAQCEKGNGRSCWNAAANRKGKWNPDASAHGKEQAFPFLEKGCNAGYAAACTQFGYALHYGNGTTANKERARTIYEKSCGMSEPSACETIGRNYAGGYDGYTKDGAKAVDFYEKACNLSDWDSCKRGARIAADGKDTKKDVARATKLYDKACTGGDKGGCNSKEELLHPKKEEKKTASTTKKK